MQRVALGIPTIKDRALQALVLLALEPEWEARFEPNSYGFRAGRSCQDAIEAIFSAIRLKPKFVLDADISKCFDRIDQETLLRKLNTFPTIRRQIRAWLKAGVMDGKQLFPTSEGTPQGGVISPLLANIALHGMEERIKQYAETLKGAKQTNGYALSLIRYADDFVILHQDITVLLKKQKGKCAYCDLFFRESDVIEVDHKIPKSQGGKDSYDNWQLLHRHCHDTKTATDLAKAKAEEMEIIKRFERVKAIAKAYANNTNPNLRQYVDVPGSKSGCNSAEPKPTKRLEKVEGKWVMRYA